MSEVQTINDVAQIGFETTPGTAVAATKRISAASISATAHIETKQYKAKGYRFHTVNTVDKEWTEITLASSPICYDELPFILKALFGSPTITTPGGGTNTRQHAWSPSTTAPLNAATFTLEQGSPTEAERAVGCQFTGLTFAFDRNNGASFSGKGIGMKLTPGVQLSTNATYTLTAAASPPTAGNYTLTVNGVTTANIAFGATPAAVQTALEALAGVGVGQVVVTLATLGPTTATANTTYTIEFRGLLAGQAVTVTGTFTGLTPSNSITVPAGAVGSTPTSLPLVPVEMTDVSIYVDPTAAGLGTTKEVRPHHVTVEMADLYGPYWVINSANTSYVANVEIEPKTTVTLVAQKNSAGIAYLTKAEVGTRSFMRVEAIGNIIEAALTYRLRLDVAFDVTGVNFGADQGVDTIEITGVLMHDTTWGKAITFEVRNTLTAVS